MNGSPILVISGTNRPNSNTLKLAKVIVGHYARLNVPAELYSLCDLPPELFDPAAYIAKPPAFVAVQERVVAAPGLHVVTPEYNGSFPGALKYFIDMLKFPESFQHKPVAFVGAASGMFGALRPVEHLMGVFSYRNAHLYPDRVFVSGVGKKFDETGRLNDEAIDQRLAVQAEGFAAFIGKLSNSVATPAGVART
jgi:NAD(P)H-dependent FMN reductase